MTGPSGPTKEHTGGIGESSGLRRSEPRYLAIGRVTRAHGLRGEVSITVLTDFPERFRTTDWVYLGNEFEAAPHRLVSHRRHKNNILLTLDGITNRAQAEQLKGQFVQVPVEDAVPLPEGTYYLFQLLDLDVKTTTGELLGTIVDILETGANDVYVVQNNKDQVLLPAIPDVVKSIDLEKGRMLVELLDGLI